MSVATMRIVRSSRDLGGTCKVTMDLLDVVLLICCATERLGSMNADYTG